MRNNKTASYIEQFQCLFASFCVDSRSHNNKAFERLRQKFIESYAEFLYLSAGSRYSNSFVLLFFGRAFGSAILLSSDVLLRWWRLNEFFPILNCFGISYSRHRPGNCIPSNVFKCALSFAELKIYISWEQEEYSTWAFATRTLTYMIKSVEIILIIHMELELVQLLCCVYVLCTK